MVHAQKVVLEILWQITKPRSKNIFKKWVLCDEKQEIIAAVPQAGTRPPGQPDTYIGSLMMISAIFLYCF